MEAYVVQNADVIPAELRAKFLKAVGMLGQLEIALSALRTIQLSTAHDPRPLCTVLALIEAIVGEIESALNCEEVVSAIARELAASKAMAKTAKAVRTPPTTPWDESEEGAAIYHGAEMPITETGDKPQVGDTVKHKGRDFEIVAVRPHPKLKGRMILDAVPISDSERSQPR